MNERDLRFAEVYNDLAKYANLTEVASELGVSVKTVKNTAGILRRRFRDDPSLVPELVSRVGTQSRVAPGAARVIDAVADPEEPIEDVIARAIRHNQKKAAYTRDRELVNVEIKTDGPFAVAGLPDPHLNNPGTMLDRAFREADIIRDTEGLYAVGIGDWLDNFIMGRLERERRHDEMSHTNAWRIQDHYVTTISDKLVAAIGGNHNDWVEQLGGIDALGVLFDDLGLRSIYDPDQVRVRLKTPSGVDFIHLARHVFPGHSKYNTVHGVLAWMLDRWQGEDVLWGGHIHASGHVAIEREHMNRSRVVHGIQLASYKSIDRYATKRGFRRNVPFVTPMIVHIPESRKSLFFDDFEEGLDCLQHKRKSHFAIAA